MFTKGSPGPPLCVRTFRYRVVCSAVAEIPVESHVVKDGESLWSIAQQYGIKVKTLREANRQLFRPGARCGTNVPTRDPSVVLPGERLNVPVCCCPPVSDQQELHFGSHATDKKQTVLHEKTGAAGAKAAVSPVPSAVSQIQAGEFSPEAMVGRASTLRIALPAIQLSKSVPIQGVVFGAAGAVVTAALAYMYQRLCSSSEQIVDSQGQGSSPTDGSLAGVHTIATSSREAIRELSSVLEKAHETQPAELPSDHETADSINVSDLNASLHEPGDKGSGAVAGASQSTLQSTDIESKVAEPAAADPSAALDASRAGNIPTPEFTSGNSTGPGASGSTSALALAAVGPTMFRAVPKSEDLVDVDETWPHLNGQVEDSNGCCVNGHVLSVYDSDLGGHVHPIDESTLTGHVDSIDEMDDTCAIYSAEEINKHVPEDASEDQAAQESHSDTSTVSTNDTTNLGLSVANESTEDFEARDDNEADESYKLPERSAATSSSSSMDATDSHVADITSSADPAIITADQDDISAEDWKPKQPSDSHTNSNGTHTQSDSSLNAIEGSSIVREVLNGRDATGSQGLESVASNVHTSVRNATDTPKGTEEGKNGAYGEQHPVNVDDPPGDRSEFGFGGAEATSSSTHFDGTSFLSHTIGFMARSTGLLNRNSFLGNMAARGGEQPTSSSSSKGPVFPTQMSDDWEQLEDCLSTLVKEGITFDSHQQGELEALVLQMESLAAMHEPKRLKNLLEIQALTGTWKLLLSTDVQTQSVLKTISMIPFLSLGDVTQRIDTRKGEVETRVILDSPTKINLSMLGSFKLKSSKRAVSKHHTCVIDCPETPQLFPNMQVPQTVTVGDEHDIDISAVQRIVDILQSAVQDAVQLATTQEIPVGSDSSVWLNTVVRDNFRICRGSDSEILVFERCP